MHHSAHILCVFITGILLFLNIVLLVASLALNNVLEFSRGTEHIESIQSEQ